MFEFIGRYFWVICIAFTVFNFKRAQPDQHSSSSAFDPRVNELVILKRRALVVNLIPWVVMGAGILIGGVPSVWQYFRPQDLNPYVWAWYASIFALACTFAFWVIFRGGAEKAIALKLVRINFFGWDVQLTQRWMKVYAAISPVFIALWIFFAWHLDAQVPK